MAQPQRKPVDLDAIEKAASAPALVVDNSTADPAPTPAQEAARQICNLSSAMCGRTKQTLRALRDEIDDLMRTLDLQDAQFGAFAAHAAQTADQCADASDIIAESLGKLRAQIGQNVAPTITVARGS